MIWLQDSSVKKKKVDGIDCHFILMMKFIIVCGWRWRGDIWGLIYNK